MKNNQMTFILAGVFFLSTLATAGLLYRYNSSYRQLQLIHPTAMKVVMDVQRLMPAMAQDAIEYSKKNPAIEPLLQLYGLPVGNKAAPVAPANTRPVNK